jgi:hypothetical protein
VCGGVGCGGVGSLLTFDIPQTALVATLDTYDFYWALGIVIPMPEAINATSLISKQIYFFQRSILGAATGIEHTTQRVVC